MFFVFDFVTADDQEEEDEENETPDDETINQVIIWRVDKVRKTV